MFKIKNRLDKKVANEGEKHTIILRTRVVLRYTNRTVQIEFNSSRI